MSSERFIFVVTLLVPTIFTLIRAQADPLCEGLTDGEIHPFPHESNCSLYYECLNGNKTLYACNNGLWYNNRTQSCDFPSDSGCTHSDPQCAGINLDYLPHSYNCSLYIECYQGNSYIMRCPSGYWFDSALKACLLPEESNCVDILTTPQPLCIGVRPNQTVLSRYDGDCRRYWKCTGADLTLEDCSSGLLFDQERQMCDFPELVACDDSTRTPDPSTVTPPATPTTPSETDPRCVDSDTITYWPHPEQCHLYVECYYGSSYEMECPSGLYFSDAEKMCVQPSLSECGQVTIEPGTTSERPSGWTSDPDCPWPEGEGRLLPYPGDCTRFYECAEGKKVAMPCPAGLWFNPVATVCDYPYQAGCTPPKSSLFDWIYRFIFA